MERFVEGVGALCEDTSATAPESNIKINIAHFVNISPLPSPKAGESEVSSSFCIPSKQRYA
tara:strand:+ start:241 stop:423 length:183 start_codon:yes stop_codon:yes gene_type:complete